MQTLVAVRIGFVIGKVKSGLGKHRNELSDAKLGKYQHFDYLEWLTVRQALHAGFDGEVCLCDLYRLTYKQVFLILALSKISFCLFLLQISQFNKLNKLKKVLWVLIGIVVCFTLPLFFLFLFQCDPIRKYWHREIDDRASQSSQS